MRTSERGVSQYLVRIPAMAPLQAHSVDMISSWSNSIPLEARLLVRFAPCISSPVSVVLADEYATHISLANLGL